jgi:hypothetical protein
LDEWSSVPFSDLREWLRKTGYDLVDRARLRPLFALGLQHAFHAHRARVGWPKSPPLFQSLHTELWWHEGRGANRSARLRLTRWEEGGASLFLDSNSKMRCMLDVSIVSTIRQHLAKESAALELRLGEAMDDESEAVKEQRKLVAASKRALANNRLWDTLSRQPQPFDLLVPGIPMKIFRGKNPSGINGPLGLELHVAPAEENGPPR